MMDFKHFTRLDQNHLYKQKSSILVFVTALTCIIILNVIPQPTVIILLQNDVFLRNSVIKSETHIKYLKY